MNYTDTGTVAAKRPPPQKKKCEQRYERLHTTEGNRVQKIISVNSLSM